MCKETFFFTVPMVQNALSPKGGIRIPRRVVCPAVLSVDRQNMKLVLFCIDVASNPDHTIFVALQNARIRDFPLLVEIRQQWPSVIADLAEDRQYLR